METLAIPRTDSGELFVRWQKHGDQRAREELVERFLPLARKLARRYISASEPYDIDEPMLTKAIRSRKRVVHSSKK